MVGPGSEPAKRREKEESRVVTRSSGMFSSREMHPEHPVEMYIQEYRPKVASGQPLSENGTRYSWQVNAGPDATVMNRQARSGSVRTLKRARAAVRSGARRFAEGRDRYTGPDPVPVRLQSRDRR